jgi:hypothetical protein
MWDLLKMKKKYIRNQSQRSRDNLNQRQYVLYYAECPLEGGIAEGGIVEDGIAGCGISLQYHPK